MFFSHAPEDSLMYVLCFWGNTANHQFRETTTKYYSEKLISFFFFVLSNWTFILAPRRLCSSSTRFSPLRSSDSASWHDDVRNICIRNIWQIHKRNNPDWLLSCKRWLNLVLSSGSYWKAGGHLDVEVFPTNADLMIHALILQQQPFVFFFLFQFWSASLQLLLIHCSVCMRHECLDGWCWTNLYLIQRRQL